MKCPVDGATLVISERQGVEIDYCPECRGVWLDRGELDKIIERTNVTEEDFVGRDRRTPFRDDDYPGGRRPQKRRKTSFLDEIFDF